MQVALVAVVAVFGLGLYRQAIGRLEVAGSARPQLAAARLIPGTEGLLRQAAEHLSKMQGGKSVGGFPAFEPPDDKYRSKIKNRSYSAEEANHWVKEINNLLRQIAEKNPGLTLEEILQRQGLTPREIDDFIIVLKNVQATARGMEGYGVTTETMNVLNGLFETLGVVPW